VSFGRFWVERRTTQPEVQGNRLEGGRRRRIIVRGRRFAVTAGAFLALGLVFFSASLEALRPLCGGRRATIAANDRRIKGTRGPDVILGGRGPNLILGGRGNDVVCAGRGRDVVRGGRGKDTIDGKKDADRVFGGRGSDELDGGAGRDRVVGGYGNDVVRGGSGDRDRVEGEMGDDLVAGGRGNSDLIVGGVGRDRIDGGPGAHDTASYLTAGGPVVVDLERGLVTGAERERLHRIDAVRTPPESNQSGAVGLVITAGDGADDLFVGFRRHRFVVFGVAPGSLRVNNPGLDPIVISLGAGDDRIRFSRSVPVDSAFTIDGGAGSDRLRGGPGSDVMYGGDDSDPDWLAGGGGRDVLFGVNISHPRLPSGRASLRGGGGNDLLVGGQPCDGDLFDGGAGRFDSASFARVRNPGTVVEATIGGSVVDPDIAGCAGGWVADSTEKIEGSTGPDELFGRGGADLLFGRGGADLLVGRGGDDRCIGGNSGDRTSGCEYVR
jgi:Ca2+-binding RTX toxin-like protein